MKKTKSLNELYKDFSTGKIKKKEFITAIFNNIREYKKLPQGWNLDDYNDYISWLYPRICSSIISYQETGSAFENYLNSMLKMSQKEFRSNQRKTNIEETAAWITQVTEFSVNEQEPVYNEIIADQNNEITKIRNKRQLLILILKCCAHVSIDFLEKVSPLLRIEYEELKRMINVLRKNQRKRNVYVSDLKEKINTQFFRCILYEKKLKDIPAESITAQKLRELLERGRKRLDNMRKRLENAHTGPSNIQIAKILGVSKGTIDSTMYNIKNKINKERKEKKINSP